jgi:DNA-binding NarL/FixJ family response regulator
MCDEGEVLWTGMILKSETEESRCTGEVDMREPRRMVVAEDHKILREGLISLLAGRDDIKVVGEAEDGLEAIRRVDQLQPDLVLLDLSMPRMDGLSAIREIKTRAPKTKILALTIHESEDFILEAFKSGADGYCLKDASSSELLMAIKSVLSGKRYLSPGISEKVLEGYIEGRKTLKTSSSWDTITQREKEILKMVGEGYKNREIADFLCISTKTVEKHRSNIMRKLDIHTASGLTALAIEKGLVTKPVRMP